MKYRNKLLHHQYNMEKYRAMVEDQREYLVFLLHLLYSIENISLSKLYFIKTI